MGVLSNKWAGFYTVYDSFDPREMAGLLRERAEVDASEYGHVLSVDVEPVLACPEEDPYCPLYGYDEADELSYEDVGPHAHFRAVAVVSTTS